MQSKLQRRVPSNWRVFNAEETVSYYEKGVLNTELPDHKRCGWRTPSSQNIRFLTLSLISDLNGCEVIDIGCGLGDFFGYLVKENIQAHYVGIDISEKMVQEASQKYPEGTFVQADFMSDTFIKPADFFLASGAFSLVQEDQGTYIRKAIKKMFDLAQQGVAFNLLSSYADKSLRSGRFYYYNPCEILEYCLTLTKYVELKQSYHPEDFTIYLYK